MELLKYLFCLLSIALFFPVLGQEPELVLPIGHTGMLKSFSFSPNGKYAISGGADKKLILWEVATGRELRSFYGHSNWVTSVAFSPDGKIALTGSIDGALILWDIATGNEIQKLGYHPHNWTDDDHLSTCRGHQDNIFDTSFSTDGKIILSIGNYHEIKLWNTATGKELQDFEKPIITFTNTNIAG